MRRTKEKESVIHQIDKCLPQTHCQKCGFVSCLPYAKAIVKKRLIFTSVNQAVLSGRKTWRNYRGKIVRANIKEAPPELVYINPEACIGCTLCIQKCPVDAIAGAEGFLHTVIVDECNGCGFV